VVLTLPALAPLARSGFFESHDGLFHIYRLAALDRAVRSGVLYPRWFPEFAFGYGQPVLNFYGPLSYYWGLPFTLLGADAVLAMKLVLATGLIASALGMYLFARLHLDRGPAFVAAVVYTYLPYHLVDLYARGAVAEFLAFVWFPLVLWAFHHLIEDSEQRSLTWLALAPLSLVALVITHSLSALIFGPVLAAYIVLLLWGRHDRRTLSRIVMALLLTIALSAFYWLPLLVESRYVGLGYGTSQGYRDHLLPVADLVSLTPTYDYALDPAIPSTFPLGWVQVALLLAGLLLLFRFRQQRWFVLLWLAVALFSAFMLATASLPAWKVLEPVLAFLQYPWRFQAITVLATAIVAGALLPGLARFTARGQVALGGLILLVTGFWALGSLPVKPILPDLSVQEMWRRDQEFGQVGATWTGEYLPIWVTEQRWAISHPAPEPALDDTVLPAGEFRLAGVGYTRYELEQPLSPRSSAGATLILHQFYYPGWWAEEPYSEGVRYESQPAGALGLVAFHLNERAGRLPVRLSPTPVQFWSMVISLVAALAVGVAFVVGHRPRRNKSVLLSAICCLPLGALAAILLASLSLPNGYLRPVNQANANLEDSVELLAYTTDKAVYHPADAANVTLYWRALRGLDRNYKTFVHLTDAATTRQPAQHDGDPGGGFTPTSRWLPGELVPDTHTLALPADLAPGRYRLWAGMYNYETVRNLAVRSSDVPAADGRILLGEIEVVAP